MRKRPFETFESSLEALVERPFERVFRASIQPAEIGNRLRKSMQSGEIVTVRGKVAPNDFVVVLNPADFVPFEAHGPALASQLSQWLDETALDSGLTTLASVRVRFRPDSRIKRGRFEIEAQIRDVVDDSIGEGSPERTEVFEIVERRQPVIRGYIEVCSGPETGVLHTLRKSQVSIGRDLGNDVVLLSPEISRYHADLEFLGDQVIVNDRSSLNGTFVNGHRIAFAQILQSGDQLVFGTTICRFWKDHRD